MTRAAPGLLVLLTLFAAPPTAARQVVHNTAPGETLASIAQRYYGVPELGESLRVHNSLSAGRLTPGSVIEIPLADDHEIVAGEDWGTLADRYWGDRELGPALALLVEPAGATLEAGTRVQVPALVDHRVRRGENLAVLTRRSYGRRSHGDAERIQALALLNGIDQPNRLGVGQPLRLPVLGELPGEGAPVRGPVLLPDPPNVSAAGPPRPDLSQSLADAVDAYYQGEFDAAREALEALRPDLLAFGTERQQRTLLSYLLLVHVAFDDAAAACASWAELRGRLDDATLDADLFSPKVVRMSRDCDAR